MQRTATRPQPSRLDPYLAYLQERRPAGWTHTSQFWREIHAQGYHGGRRQVARWVLSHGLTALATGGEFLRFVVFPDGIEGPTRRAASAG